MKSIFKFILLSTIIILSSCNGGKTSNNERPKTSEELRTELKLLEEMSPLEYLEVKDVTMTEQQKKVKKGGLLRDPKYAPDGAIFKGNFINKATLTKYKDIKVNISYFSKTKTLIKEESYIIYEFYQPNSTNHFSLKVSEIPKITNSFDFEIIGANSSNQ